MFLNPSATLKVSSFSLKTSLTLEIFAPTYVRVLLEQKKTEAIEEKTNVWFTELNFFVIDCAMIIH